MPKAVRFHEFGGPDVLKIEEVSLREPGPGEVTLEVAAVGLNRAESLYFHGQYFEQPRLPSGVGYEAVGTILKIGPDVDPSLIGKQFGTIPGFSMNQFPVLGEQATVPVSELAALPPTLSPVEAAAVWMQYPTAYGALVYRGKVGPGDFVILTAASSSVGLAAIQIVRAQGGTAIAATRTLAKKQQLLDLGAHHVVATQDEDLPARVSEITGGKGARIVFDPVGGDYVGTLAKATAAEGTIFLYGLLSGQPPVYPIAAFGRGISLTSYAMTEMKVPGRFEAMKTYIYDHLLDGTFKPRIAKTFPFAQTADAYKYLESNEQVGKVVVTF